MVGGARDDLFCQLVEVYALAREENHCLSFLALLLLCVTSFAYTYGSFSLVSQLQG